MPALQPTRCGWILLITVLLSCSPESGPDSDQDQDLAPDPAQVLDPVEDPRIAVLEQQLRTLEAGARSQAEDAGAAARQLESTIAEQGERIGQLEDLLIRLKTTDREEQIIEVAAELIRPNVYSGGAARPILFVDCYLMDAGTVDGMDQETLRAMPPLGVPTPGWDGKLDGRLSISLLSPSLQASKAVYDPTAGRLRSSDRTESWGGSLFLSLESALSIFAGIEPGGFEVEQRHPLLVVEEGRFERLVDSRGEARGHAEARILEKLLPIAFEEYLTPQYPTRAASEYSASRTRLFVESDGADAIIGHYSLSLSGEAARQSVYALNGLSGGCSEIVYCGELPEDRGSVLETLGFPEAAAYFATWQSAQDPESSSDQDWRALIPRGPIREWLVTSWRAKVVPPSEFDPEAMLERWALSRWRSLRIARIISSQPAVKTPAERALLLKELQAEALLPPFLAFPQAAAAYWESRSSRQPATPDALFDNLHRPLGFVRRVVNELALEPIEKKR